MQTFPPSSAESYKALARTWAATVTVVTARRGEPQIAAGASLLDGFTATAFLTISMSPPIIAVSATAAGSAFALLRDAEAFAVNLLAADQSDLAGAFARPAADRASLWESVKWIGDEAGAPLLAGTTGAFSAKVRQLVDAGDHVLVLGDVTAIHLGDRSDTLVYHDRGYGKVARLG